VLLLFLRIVNNFKVIISCISFGGRVAKGIGGLVNELMGESVDICVCVCVSVDEWKGEVGSENG